MLPLPTLTILGLLPGYYIDWVENLKTLVDLSKDTN